MFTTNAIFDSTFGPEASLTLTPLIVLIMSSSDSGITGSLFVDL